MDYSKVFETMVQETQKYLEDNNLWAMILGISGGIDSTVTAAICHEVEKRNPDIKFIGVSLPCTSNSEAENSSAKYCLNGFCKENQYYTENLQKEYMLMRATCSQRHSMTTIGAGNIKARLRMIALYNEANYFSGLVMDTDNLTEHYLGFFTIHGDVCDFNPIGGLWKHEVYELAKYIKHYYIYECKDEPNEANIINALDLAIGITPTDGNGVKSGGDMAQIAPAFINDKNIDAYTKVDDIIQTYLNDIKTYYEDITSGLTQQLTSEKTKAYKQLKDLYEKYGVETVDGIISRIRRTEYKRKELPVVIPREKYEMEVH